MLPVPSIHDLTLDSWITSDHHWEHPNIRRYQDRPEDHFERMREEWLRLVGPRDVLLHLGDIVCFGDPQQHPRWIRGLPGKKYLLRGNHDKHTDQWYGAAGFTVLGRKPFYWHRPDTGELICFSHEPEYDQLDWTLNVHGHIHSNPYWDGTLRDEDRRNVCVERTGYAPMRLRDVLDGPNLAATGRSDFK